MCRKEEIFLSLSFTGILDNFIKIIIGFPEFQQSPRIQYHYIHLIACIFKHKSGIQWISATNFWYDIYTLTTAKTDERVFMEGCKFLVDLIDVSKHDNQIYYNNVLKILLAPLFTLGKVTNSSDVDMEMEEIDDDIMKRLQVLDAVFYEMLVKSCNENNYRFISFLQNQFKIDQVLEELAKNIRIKEVSFLLNKLSCVVIYYTAAVDLKYAVNITVEDRLGKLNLYTAKICDIFYNIAQAANGYKEILEFVSINYAYFKIIVKNSQWVTFLTEKFHFQMIFFMLAPICHICELNKISDFKNESEDDMREKLISSVIRQCSPLVLQLTRKIRNNASIEEAVMAFRYTQHFCKMFEKCVITNIAQLSLYLLKDAIKFFEKSEDISTEIQEMVVAIVETIIFLFTEFDLSWRDSVEMIYVAYTTLDMLRLSNLSIKLITRMVQLANVAIRRNLSPEMSLLADNTDQKNEHAVQFTEMLKNNLNHSYWEIRNAAVQVLHAIAQTKQDYRSVKSIIEREELSEIMLKMAGNDPESSVRISALRCFQDLVREGLCDHLLETDDFYAKILETTKTESAGNIKSEYIIVISVLYEHKEVADNIVETIYDLITSAVLEDECLSVKTSALACWQKVIEKHLQSEGMIDGDFPSMTFSKEKKKIVTLNKRSIKKSLRKVLYKLSEIGCLTSFLFALNPDLDPFIVQTASILIKSFVELLKKYYWEPIAEKEFVSYSMGDTSPRPSTNTNMSIHTNTSSDSNSNTNDAEMSPSSSSSNMFSPYPESLYEDILDLQDTLIPEPDLVGLLQDSNMEDPATIQLNEFLLYVENLDFSLCDKRQAVGPTEENIDILLNSLL